MISSPPSHATARPVGRARAGVGLVRIGVGGLVVVVLLHAYVVGIPQDGANPFDYFGYFTNQTSLLASATLIATGAGTLRGLPAPGWLVVLRAIATACMIVVAVVYNVLVPGTGSAAPWVSAVLHIAFPLLIMLDWLLVGDRPPLPWRSLWIVLPYPVLWLAVVLVRGLTDGWVPYGFLLPDRGGLSLWAHVAGLLAALAAAGALVWAGSRVDGPTALLAHRTPPQPVNPLAPRPPHAHPVPETAHSVAVARSDDDGREAGQRVRGPRGDSSERGS